MRNSATLAAICGVLGCAPALAQQKPANPPASAWTTPDPFSGLDMKDYKTPAPPPAKLDSAFDQAAKAYRDSPVRPTYDPVHRAPMLQFRQKF